MTKIDVELVNEYMKLVIPLISLILTTLVYPWLKSKIGDAKLSEIEKYTRFYVRCAEQIYTTDEWKEKKAYVLEFISQKAEEIGYEISAEDLNAIIEGCVNEIKKG